MNNAYEVLSPWAEVDPIPPRGISPRLNDLAGKRIGLFCAFKRAARPINTVVERKLKERFPSSEFSYFIFGHNDEAILTEDKARYEDWIKGVDAVVAAVGD